MNTKEFTPYVVVGSDFITILERFFQTRKEGWESIQAICKEIDEMVGFTVTGMGLVAEVFDARTLEHLERHAKRGAIGHNRYSTAGGSMACNAQPLIESYIKGQVAVAHNGNLINADLMRRQFEERGHLFHTTSDTEVMSRSSRSMRCRRRSSGPSKTGSVI